MNIDELYTLDAHEAGAEMQVKDQFGKDTDLFIKFVGIDSKKWRDIYRKNQRKLVTLSGDDLEQAIGNSGAEILAEAAIDWRGAKQDGKDVPFSVKALQKLLNSAPYIKEQADEFIAKRANFTQS